MEECRLLIDGRWVSGSGGTHVTCNPYSGEAVARVLLGSPQQVGEAVEAARAAFRTWKRVPAHRRSEMLLNAAKLVRERSEELARTIAAENGKPIRSARAEVSRAATTFQLAAGEAGRMLGETIPMDLIPGSEGRLGFYFRQPVGVVAAITPFNFPLNLAVHKVAPALAAGNTVVLKPSSQTPLTGSLLGRIVTDAGFPSGAVNVVPCARETVEALVTHPDVAMVSFTGSVAVGRSIRERAGLKRVALELGSNSGNIVSESADLEQAAAACVVGGFTYAGQVCISVQRVFVQRRVMPDFMALFLPKVKALRLGDPQDDKTDVGPLISDEAAARLGVWLREAVDGGAEVLCGGNIDGRMMQPTVLAKVQREMKVVCEEVFAPLVSVVPFDTFAEAIAMVNDSRYGLNAGVFTRDLNEAFTAVRELEVGSVIINDSSAYRADHMPYGGVKSSGLGREAVRFAMEEMTEIKFAAIRLPEA
ncbi:MAG: aldehyde dehydrogenase family protein [Dehalococcoidia bacterium]|nr:aldehyde dehydrogenase family protein [Dehalococcoidia bacterium]